MLDNEEILSALFDMSRRICYHGPMMNERYLHHHLSFKLQQIIGGLDLFKDASTIKIHPEWPTCKKSTNLSYGKYRKIGGEYLPVADGSAGFIDFALGNYNKPEIGIELTFKVHGFSREELVYDFVKLLDSRNPFTYAYSLNIIYHDKQAEKGRLGNFEDTISNLMIETKLRLGDLLKEGRYHFFIITEVDTDNKRQHWLKNHSMSNFKKIITL